MIRLEVTFEEKVASPRFTVFVDGKEIKKCTHLTDAFDTGKQAMMDVLQRMWDVEGIQIAGEK